MSDTYTAKPGLTDKAKEVVREVKAKASEMTEGVTQAAKDNAAQLGDAASAFAGHAKEKAGEAVTRQRSVGADYIASIAQATHRAAGEFDSDLPQAAQYIRRASGQIQSVADTVRERDARELINDVQAFARRQPTLFFGGAVVLGFAALRFLKSAAPEAPASTAFDASGEG